MPSRQRKAQAAEHLSRSWLTVRSTHTLTEEVFAPPHNVRDFYVDLDNLRTVHPLIVSVRPVARTESPAGYQQTYRVGDRIPLGPLRLPITYVAQMTVPRIGDVRAQARQFPYIRLNTTVTFQPYEGGTRITERIVIDAPRLLAMVTRHQALKAHTAMLAGIRQRFG